MKKFKTTAVRIGIGILGATTLVGCSSANNNNNSNNNSNAAVEQKSKYADLTEKTFGNVKFKTHNPNEWKESSTKVKGTSEVTFDNSKAYSRMVLSTEAATWEKQIKLHSKESLEKSEFTDISVETYEVNGKKVQKATYEFGPMKTEVYDIKLDGEYVSSLRYARMNDSTEEAKKEIDAILNTIEHVK